MLKTSEKQLSSSSSPRSILKMWLKKFLPLFASRAWLFLPCTAMQMIRLQDASPYMYVIFIIFILKTKKVDFISVKKMLHQSFYPSAGRILFITVMNGFPFLQKLSRGMASLYHFLVVHSRSYCFSGTGTHRLYYLVQKMFLHTCYNK